MRNAVLGLLVVSAGCGRALEVPEDKLPETCVEDAHFVFGLTKKGVPANSAQLDDVASVILPLDGIWMVYTRNTVGQDRWLEATFSTPPMPGRIYSAVTHPAQPYDVTVRYNETVDGESVSYSSQKGMVSFGISKCSGQLRVLFSNVTVANARGSFALGGELSVFDFTQSGDRSCARDGAALPCGDAQCDVGQWCDTTGGTPMCRCGEVAAPTACGCLNVDRAHAGCGLLSACP